jgi:hypothetical protein
MQSYNRLDGKAVNRLDGKEVNRLDGKAVNRLHAHFSYENILESGRLEDRGDERITLRCI